MTKGVAQNASSRRKRGRWVITVVNLFSSAGEDAPRCSAWALRWRLFPGHKGRLAASSRRATKSLSRARPPRPLLARRAALAAPARVRQAEREDRQQGAGGGDPVGAARVCYVLNVDLVAKLEGSAWQAYPVGVTGPSNGLVQSATHQAKVLAYRLEPKSCRATPGEHTVKPQMVECIAVLINSCEVSWVGFNAYRRPNGKDGAKKGISFGSKALLRRKPLPHRKSKMGRVWGCER